MDLNWDSPLSSLNSTKRPSKTIEKLEAHGVNTLSDLLWILPNKIIEIPPVKSFNNMSEGEIFTGRGKILNVLASPNFWKKGKGRGMLYTVTVLIKDLYSSETISLKWFNSYSSVNKKIENLEYMEFSGVVNNYRDDLTISNPEFKEANPSESINEVYSHFKVAYPTINGISGTLISKLIKKVPKKLWDSIPDFINSELKEKRGLISRALAFKHLHGHFGNDPKELELAKRRIIYDEFFVEQIKIQLRRKKNHTISSSPIYVEKSELKKFQNIYPFELTVDQKNALKEIAADLSSEHPMMRLIQGDVGCGKTAIATISSLMAISSGHQVAFMCPTEALALQHFLEIEELFLKKFNYKVALILGSTKAKEKNEIKEKLKSGEIHLILGTHALIQSDVEFKSLGLAIIDEQHKFGVDQRLKLISKGNGVHSLIMTATPIPRSLCLTQYGDLDISLVKSMPKTRKGHKTKIIYPATYKKFLSFFKTRLSMNEQAYVVVPAIEENEGQTMLDLETVLSRFKKYFPEYEVQGIHGQLKPADKSQAFLDFKNKKTDILVATSVVEVGINVPNATIMAIMNPERFGLSSLHQLRGRIGRGDKPGFCFLVNETKPAALSLNRLQILEDSSDGFQISEKDLEIRGRGDLFGSNQSGHEANKKFANIILHKDILDQAQEDATNLFINPDKSFKPLLSSLKSETKVFLTV